MPDPEHPAATLTVAIHQPVLAETRRDNFNAIRLALALGVLLSHSYAMVGLPEPIVMGRTLGNLCVHGFFAISGYMITLSFVRSHGVARFAVHRMLRIGPALVVALLFTRALRYGVGDFAANPIPHIMNGVIWTIPWEAVCYVLAAAAGVLGILNPERFNVFLATVLVFAFADAHWGSESYLVLMPLMLLFAGGAFLAIYEPRINVRRLALAAAVAAALVHSERSLHLVQGLVDWVPWSYPPGGGFLTLHTCLHLFAVPVLALWLGHYAPPVFALRSDLSYGAYLYGWPVQQTLVAGFLAAGWKLSPLVLFVLALAGTLLLAWASWVVIERPALRLKNLDLPRMRTMLARARRA